MCHNPETHKKIAKCRKLAFLRQQIASKPKWAIRAMQVIYGFQTEAEKSTGKTINDNKRGFTIAHADIFKTYVENIDNLTPKQIAYIQKTMPKYVRQILEVSDVNKLDRMYREHQKTHPEQMELKLGSKKK